MHSTQKKKYKGMEKRRETEIKEKLRRGGTGGGGRGRKKKCDKFGEFHSSSGFFGQIIFGVQFGSAADPAFAADDAGSRQQKERTSYQ